MATERATRMREADKQILLVLRRDRVQYPALLAAETGLHLPLVERRCDALESRDLIEPVTGEVLYRLTERGRRAASEES